MLCKNLALDISELKPGNLLKDKDRLKSLDEQLSAPKKDAKQPEELPPIVTTSKCQGQYRCIVSEQRGLPSPRVALNFYTLVLRESKAAHTH